MSQPRHAWMLVIIAVLLLTIDLATKLLAETNLTASQPVALLDGYLRLTLVHNTGTAFGLLPGQRLPFILFSSVAIIAILVLYRRMHHRSTVHVLAMGLLLGGAIGNVHDRVRFGAVTDFIEIGVAGHYWPVFNVADASITAGVILLMLTMLRHGVPEETAAHGFPGEQQIFPEPDRTPDHTPDRTHDGSGDPGLQL